MLVLSADTFFFPHLVTSNSPFRIQLKCHILRENLSIMIVKGVSSEKEKKQDTSVQKVFQISTQQESETTDGLKKLLGFPKLCHTAVYICHDHHPFSTSSSYLSHMLSCKTLKAKRESVFVILVERKGEVPTTNTSFHFCPR